MIFRVLKSLYRFGVLEGLRSSFSGSARPCGIGFPLMLRKGVLSVGPRGLPLTLKTGVVRRLVREAREIDIVLSMLWGGGAAKYLDARIAEAPAGRLTFVVRPCLDAGGRLAVEAYRGPEKRAEFFVRSLSAFRGLRGLNARIVVNELAQWWLYDRSGELSSRAMSAAIDSILDLRAAIDARIVYLVHDYLSVCPRFTLLSPAGVYCGAETGTAGCGKCLADARCANVPIAKGTSREEWLAAFGRLFAAAAEVRTFSEDTRSRIARVFPGVHPTLVPHRALAAFPRRPSLRSGPPTIGVFGFIQLAKGSAQVLALAEYLRSIGEDDARIAVVGEIVTGSGDIPPNVTMTGAYAHEDLPAIIEREGINVAYFSSVCPETFSFVTRELIALGLPVVCHDLGAPRDAVAKYDRGEIASSFAPRDVYVAVKRALERGGRRGN